MKAVLQRVDRAMVVVDGAVVGECKSGLLVYLGVASNDQERDAETLVDKIIGLRVFAGDNGTMQRSLVDVHGDLLFVSQFTLLADTSRGRRPSFFSAADPKKAEALYDYVVRVAQGRGVRVAQGVFGAHMSVEATNNGPVTILLDTENG